MVFESYVVDLLNKFAGQYLENLDSSQLRLGIWGGDVKLENLILKESALDDLDLPVKVLRGHLGKLVLKIPWKNLYSEPVIAQVDGLYLLVRPNTAVKYNEEKEEKAKQEKKQRQLEAVELARKLEEEKKQNAPQKDEKSDSFVEKLAIQIVKNLQISVRNIHVRYEDSVTNPSSPFSIGVTLENLSAVSTDANWIPSIVSSSVQIVHKLVKLDSLSLYWNTNDSIGKLPSQEDWVNQAKGGIAVRTSKYYSPPDFKYILQPISATTKVKMNIKPGCDLSIPKIFLSLVLQEISLVLMRQQYRDVMELLESFDRMATNSTFRKYKPKYPLHGHAKQWWKYAITSILEEDVRRRMRNWSWRHMKKHRDLCRKYKDLYKQKLLQDKPSDSLVKKLEELENQLDVLNITICRRQAAYEEAAALRKKKKKAEDKKSGGWFSGWFGSTDKSKKEEQTEILTEEQKKEELEKLYSAIGYSEGEVVTAFPKEYVENKVIVHLKQITVALRDDTGAKSVDVARLSFQDLLAELSQRTSAQAIKLTAKVDMMKMFGSAGSDGKMPLMMTSQNEKTDQHLALFTASFETNPLDGKCDQRATVSSQPVKVIYNANTIGHVITFFQPPKDVHLSELSAAAYSRLQDLKSVSKASLSYAIEHHKITDVNVDVKSPFIIIPEGGTFKKSSDVLIVDLGHLKITSDPEQERIVSTKDLSVKDLESKCYDKFDFRLEQLQVLIARAGDDWQAARKQVKSKMHILDPMEIDMKLQKALNPDDIRLAQIKVSGSLPSVKVHVSDDKLQQVIKLAKSIPIPGGETALDQTDSKPVDIPVDDRHYGTRSHSEVTSLGVLETSTEEDEGDEMFMSPPETLSGESKLEQAKLEAKEALAKQVKISLEFEIEKIAVDVSTVDKTGDMMPCLELSINGLATKVLMHPWDLTASASLGSLAVKEMTFGPDGGPLYLVQTPVGAELLSVKFLKVESDHPEYRSRFKSTQQSVDIEFSSLQVKLHQEALLNIIDLSTKMLPPSEESPPITGDGSKTEDQGATEAAQAALRKSKKRKDEQEEVQIEVTAKLGGIGVTVTSVDGDLSHIIVGGLSAYCVVKGSRTEVSARMRDLSVMDSTPGALYQKIVSIVNQEVFSLEVVAYNEATSGDSFRNMEAVDVKFQMGIGCIRVVFLNKFIMRLLDFLNKFQRAKDAMEYARKSATESATATIQNLQIQSSRISLSVSIQAPLIVIPVSSTSLDALVANLGHLSVSNSFNLVHPGDDPSGSDAVVVDNMVVELNSVQLLRAIMTDGENIGPTRLVLEPASLAVYLARNLSPWYHDIPDIDVVGKLHAVKLCAGEDDIRTIMGILFQNLSEVAAPSETGLPPEEESITPVIQQGLDAVDAGASVDATGPDVSDDVWETVKFSFEIEEVTAAVFQKETAKPSDDKSSRDPACCLGQFALFQLATSGKIKSNSAINASVTLQSCALDDKRPKSEAGITRMIERFDGGTSEAKNMIDIQFQQASNQDKTIVMGIHSFHVVVNLEYLVVLSKVFMSALTTDESAGPTPPANQPSSQAIAKQKPATVKTADEEPLQITVQILVKDPEIVLLADAKDKDTNALFLKNAVDFHFVQGHGQQKMAGSVSDVVIFSAAFDKDRRKSSKSRVLQLSHISLMSSTPEGGNMHVDVSTGMAYVHVSPPTIRTLTACLMSLAPAKSEEDQTKSTENALELWNEKPITTEDRWYLSPVPEDQLVPGRLVLARSLTNFHNYDPGFIVSPMGTHFFVQYDSCIPMFFDTNDIAAIIVDKDPGAKDLVIGAQVVAKRPKETSYVEGKVVQTKEEKKEKLYLIDFWDGVEHWNTLDKIRILTTIKPGVPRGEIVVSTIVFVRFKDDMYQKGFVTSKTYSKLVVRIYGGDVQIVHINDSAAIVPDVVPDSSALKVGTTVIATFDGFTWEAGNIAEIRHLEEKGNDIYRVRFIGGGDTWVFSVDKIRILMTRNPKVPEGVLGVGTVVWAHTSKIRYYKGFVSYKGTKLHVDLYDGDKFLYELKDASYRVIPDVPPKAADIKPGTRVIAKFKNKPRYYSSTVMEVDASDPSEPKYHVKLDDGDVTWDSLYQLRLLPKEVQVGGKEKSPDHIDANEAGNSKAELLVFEMEGFDVKLEAMLGGQVIPLLSVDGSVQGELRNWSSALTVRAGVGLIGNYFNESVSEWEPLIEPVEDDRQVYRHWECNLEFSMANGGGNDNNLGDSSEAAMSLSVESKDIMELTVTKTGLDVFTKLGTAFKEAVTLQGTGEIAMEDIPPYQIWNELGMELKIRPGRKFQSPAGVDSHGMVAVAPGQNLSLRFGKGIDKRASKLDRGSSASGMGPSIGIEVQGYHELKTISVKQARVVLHNIIPIKLLSGLIVSVVVQIETGEGQKMVTIRSPLQINNHFPIPMDLLCKKEEQFSRVTTVQPDTVYSVPLILAHKAALYLRPAGFGYGESTTPLLWNKLASEGHSSIECPPPAGDGAPFYIEVECEPVSFASVHGSLEHAPNYILHIYPPAILHNYLPYNIRYASSQGLPLAELKGGDKWPLFSVSLDRKVILQIQLDNYQRSMWKGQIELWKGMDELTTFTLQSTQVPAYGKYLELGVFATFDGTMNITLYSPYWMVNKTDLYLEYAASDDETVIPHPTSLTEPVMFSYRGKGKLFAKTTARVRLAAGEWSNKFSLDAAGSGGLLKVKKDGKLHELGMQTTLSYFSLTKIVEFTPFHLINNATEYPVSLTDSEDQSSWVTVQPGKCVPFWPLSCPSKNLAIKVGDSSEVSPRFDFEPDVTVLLKMNGKVGAVCADMLTKDSAAIITITPYYIGAAPVRIENCTQLEICYKQEGCKEHCLHPNQCVLFTWDEPAGTKEFVWFVKGSEDKIKTDLSKAGYDDFECDGKTFYWAAFLDGLQRVLLIIDDFTLAFRAQVDKKERTSQRITLGLQGVGLSLVNNEKSIEVAYIGIRPSDVIWEEQKKKGRWKAMKVRLCDELEAAWTKIQQDLSLGATPNYSYKTGDMEVDFQLMEVVRPTRQPIRRTFTPGVFLECMTSPNELKFGAKINSVQIDSQVPGATFQTVLFPVPTPKSLAAENAPKPYIELSLVTKQEEHSHVQEIKYFKVLIQEMDVKVDMGFLMALMGLFSSDTIDRSQEASQYSLDKQLVHNKLGEAFAEQAALSDGRNFFDYFHLSPLKVHLSFSQLGGGAEGDKTQTHIGGSFVSLLLQSVGVAVTEVQDVEFKLAYFEIEDKVYTQQQLIQVAVKHYTSQALKQMYVLVLGLDVLGNPFGLITGLKEGAKDFFYEPYQGLIQGPGEFAEGLAIGARSLFGHTVGGAAGAVSRITGTLGKGIAALTMDDKYQQERRQAMGKKPVNVKEGLTRGGKGLLEGVVGGVTGIVTKPMEGAKEAGAAGFFKGLGKGVVGVLARPAAGVVDFASSTLEGIKGSASTGSEVHRLRPPRCFYADKVIKPYNAHEAQGNAVLQELKKTKSALVDDTYFSHSRLNIKKTLIITNKHIIVAGKTEVFETWECDWMCGLNELAEDPTTDGQKLVLKLPDKAKGKGIFKRSGSAATNITTPSPDVAKWLVDKIKEARS